MSSQKGEVTKSESKRDFYQCHYAVIGEENIEIVDITGERTELLLQFCVDSVTFEYFFSLLL